ncbi:YbaY family lipoprotein [Methanolobus mangrovi]|uniref:YbaY family lipoprotein n=1 Tax=Methanolobus mangrovi TaxID=3072977 RepID=A0AA51UIB3_9EURY|nr:YbaY family lipoprotein [Methanolobus mangrovi]WMW23394.1 YbaY family lipoprotein [Methanolobus mangrovi]
MLIIASAISMGCTGTYDENNINETGRVDDSANNDSDENQVSEENTIQGMIIFDEPVESFSNATVYLEVDDVSLQDVASTVISEESIVGVSMNASDIQPVTYLIHYPELEEKRTYSLSVHVDVDGDGRLSNGDYYSTWHNPVPTEPGVYELDVHVEMI